MGRLFAIILFFVFLRFTSAAQQWGVSTNGNCIYDRNGNVISCQSNSACKFVATGTTRTGTYYVCDFYLGFCWIGHNENYTETYYVTECPIDNSFIIFALPIGLISFRKLRALRRRGL
ncbi:hypothetical protein [Pedobacter aquatilis]|uniref:hypothetical protein n=1 Tax=Pedobacter aquatilis TaxID=351343 RepID=UPI0029318F9B|nr:hypothetical protein [Pedobacter aquatilis]